MSQTQSIRGGIFTQDMQMHSCFSDGKNTILEMAAAAKAQGMRSIAISDHAKGWMSDGIFMEFFPDQSTFSSYLSEIAEARKMHDGELRIFSGLEIETDVEGNFLISEGIRQHRDANPGIQKLGVDIILGAIHSESIEEEYVRLGTSQEDKREVLVQAIICLIRNKAVDIIAHPFQAIHGQFSSNFTHAEASMILSALEEEWNDGHLILLELNGKRDVRYDQWTYDKYAANELDKNDESFLTRYLGIGGKFTIGSDAHSVENVQNPHLEIVSKLGLDRTHIHLFE